MKERRRNARNKKSYYRRTKRSKNLFFSFAIHTHTYTYTHYIYARIPKGERTRNRPWSKGRFALATRIECTGLPSFSSRTTMRHKGGRTRVRARQPHNARAQVSPFHGEFFVVPSVVPPWISIHFIFFSLLLPSEDTQPTPILRWT